MFINGIFKFAVLKCNDREFLSLLKLTDSKAERFIRNKRLDIIPISLFKKVTEESTEVYNKFLVNVMPTECEKLLKEITPILGESHPLVKQFTRIKDINKYSELEEILLHPDKYLSNINNPKQISKPICVFYNNILLSIDVKYLKALAASILDNL